MIASKAGETVSKFIDKSWPSGKKEIYEILELGINKAWSEGKWLGMTIEGTCQVYRDLINNQNYFLAPQSHPILLAINVNGSHTTIRDAYFKFHKNGNGQLLNSSSCQWNTDVYDLGTIPHHNKNNIDFSEGVMIGVRSIGLSGENEYVYINGTYKDGERIYTYLKSDFGDPCGCKSKPTDQTIQGIRLDINGKFNYLSGIKFSDILSIGKTITKSPVEIIAIDSFGNGYQIARLEPNQTESSYRKYLVPDTFNGKQCVHGIFKIAKQETIVSDYQKLIIGNKEALICLAMGIHAFYYKKQVEAGSSFMLQGITILEKEKRETESPSEFPIQVNIDLDGFPNHLKTFN